MKTRLFPALLAALCLLCTAGPAPAAEAPTNPAHQTRAGLYATPAEAYAQWSADQAGVTIIDVRTPEEYVFLGRAPMAANIPLQFMTHEFNPDRNSYAMESNPDFVDLVKERCKPDARILLMCRSGSRSAMAVNRLVRAGFTQAYSILDGFEGEADTDPQSPTFGQRLRSGWKNSGLPVSFRLEPDLAFRPRPRP